MFDNLSEPSPPLKKKSSLPNICTPLNQYSRHQVIRFTMKYWEEGGTISKKGKKGKEERGEKEIKECM